jgi:hypothetical protein
VLALQVNGVVSQGPWQEHGYRNTRRIDKLEGTEDLGYGAYRVHLMMLIQFQQDHSSIHDSRVVQEWLVWQADAELIGWSPRASDMNSYREYVE